MSEFGRLLRNHRENCRDPLFPARKLSQARLGEILGNELGTHGYSGAAVSDWERGKSKIHADERLVLAGLIKVLHDCGGLATLEQANQLLTVGNYRLLDAKDTERIFPGTINALKIEQPKPKHSKSFIPFLLGNLFFMSEEEFQSLLVSAEEGPYPAWPRVLAAFLRKAFDHFSIITIIWMWAWLIALWLIAPSLRWPFADRDSALLAIRLLICGTLIVPLLIGLLVNTRDNVYWKQQGQVDAFLLRLYTYQGAGIGFDAGFFIVFPLGLARYYLHLESSTWIEIAAVTMGLVLGNMGARVVPYNLWHAYGRLRLADGGIFFVVALLGPLWGFFLWEFYPVLQVPVLGTVIILIGLTIAVIIPVRQSRQMSDR